MKKILLIILTISFLWTYCLQNWNKKKEETWIKENVGKD